MNIIDWVDLKAEIVDAPTQEELVHKIETAYRICYNSLDKMDNEPIENSINFINSNISRGHGSPLEHVNITIKGTIDRGILAEITRHRIGSYSVNSTRYIKYNTRVPCILPYELRTEENYNVRALFKEAAEQACSAYQALLKVGVKAENARGLLPQCLAVNLMETHNFREWLHIFDLRYYIKTGKPHPDMRVWMHKIYREFMKLYPDIINNPVPEFRDLV